MSGKEQQATSGKEAAKYRSIGTVRYEVCGEKAVFVPDSDYQVGGTRQSAAFVADCGEGIVKPLKDGGVTLSMSCQTEKKEVLIRALLNAAMHRLLVKVTVSENGKHLELKEMSVPAK